MNATPEQRAHLRRLYDEAQELPPHSQAEFLARVRAEAGEAMAAQLEDLLKADDEKTHPSGRPPGTPGAASRDAAFHAGEMVLSRFQVVRLLGRGGMGEVYEAFDKEMGRVALKTIRHESHGDRFMLRRFKQEVQLSRIVTSPYVCRVHELFTLPAGGFQTVDAFLTMEFLEGGTLAERVREGPLAWREAEAIALQLCQGLDAIHKAGVIHRDLKSRNVMLTTRSGALCAVITDLGLALEVGATMTLAPEGTPGYMAPEQFENLPVSAATDIYALGVVLYEMVAGKHPFPSGSPMGAAVRRAKRLTPASSLQPGLPARWDRVIARCLEYDPESRYQSAPEVALALGSRPGMVKLSRRWVVAAGATVVAGFGVAGWLEREEIDRLLHPIPRPRRVIVLPNTETKASPGDVALLKGISENITVELARTAPVEGDLFVVPIRYLEKQNAGKPKEISSLFGANLILTLELDRSGKAVELVLRLVKSSTGELLRRATIWCPESALPTLPMSAFDRAAALLDIPHRNLRPEVTGGDTTNADAYAAYERARGLLRGYGLPSVDQAIGELQKAVDLDSRFARAWAKLGEAYATRFQLTKDAAALDLAERTNKKALDLAPQLSACYAGRALIELYRGEYDAAIHDSQEAAKLDPDASELRIRLAQTYLKSGKLDLAAKTYDQLATDRPNDWSVLNDWGDFDLDQANYPQAEKLFRQATLLAPQAALPWENLGAVYLAMGRLEDADRALNKSIALLPSGEAYTNLGTALFWQGKYRQAAEAYSKAVKLDPLHHVLWRNLGDAYQAMGPNGGKAAAAWQKAADLAAAGLEINPRSTDLLTNMALYKAKLGETKEALALLKRAGTFPAATVEERFNEALAYELAGDRTEALQLLEGCVRDGYSRTDLEHAPELQNLRRDPRYQAVAMKAREK